MMAQQVEMKKHHDNHLISCSPHIICWRDGGWQFS